MVGLVEIVSALAGAWLSLAINFGGRAVGVCYIQMDKKGAKNVLKDTQNTMVTVYIEFILYDNIIIQK